MRKYLIGIWGQYGDSENVADGQAVRTRIITNAIKARFGIDKVHMVNTNNWKKRKLSLLFATLHMIFYCEKIIIMPADNGFKLIVPLLNIMSYFHKNKIIYIVIGGFLPNLLRRNSKYIKYLKKYQAIFVQTTNLKQEINVLGLKNTYILSNLKDMEKRNVSDIKQINADNIKVCTLSRINIEKGILDAIDAVKIANTILKKKKIQLDIFGIVSKGFEEQFYNLLRQHSDFVEYKGVVPYDKTVGVLKDYFCLVFPTYYYGEGFAGTFIDAFFSGVPIITTNWKHNSEIIKEAKNGFLVNIKSPNEIADRLVYLYKNRLIQYEISINNLNEAVKYDPSIVLEDLFHILDLR